MNTYAKHNMIQVKPRRNAEIEKFDTSLTVPSPDDLLEEVELPVMQSSACSSRSSSIDRLDCERSEQQRMAHCPRYELHQYFILDIECEQCNALRFNHILIPTMLNLRLKTNIYIRE